MTLESDLYDNSSVSPASRPLEHLVDLFCFKGRPLNLDKKHPVTVLVNHGYVVGFSNERKQPAWAAYRVSAAERDVDYERPHLFYDDMRLPDEFRIGTWGFGKHANVPYDRGHMVPNFAINTQFGRLAQMESFFMSNICPQVASTNRGIWQKLEKKIIREYAPNWDHIWVITGPVFSQQPKNITRSNGATVAIPKSFFAVLVDPFKYPHDDVDNVHFLALEILQSAGYAELDKKHITTINKIEKATKLNLFPKLSNSERKKVEGKKAPRIWEYRER